MSSPFELPIRGGGSRSSAASEDAKDKEIAAYKLRVAELETSEADAWEVSAESEKKCEELGEVEAQLQTATRELVQQRQTAARERAQQQQRASDRRLEIVRAECEDRVRRSEAKTAVKVTEMEEKMEAKDERIRQLELQVRLQDLPRVPQLTLGSSARALPADLQSLEVRMKALRAPDADVEMEDVETTEPAMKKRKRPGRMKAM
ncbi:hypothetical protein C7974DRAFT_376724 [Boeremia exigua]|uniref:uncharacterized protein n=1 Tax=Boeremia exigua TaxID=749465 RepID=UPI001E8D3255|nr:uncharacterized protein C7974DRAFT_376724 [Boeremia exigua]KAH6625164.1 hypothetical protein C7974DRAFT_376724 [Boeremia exigua]